MIQRQSTFCNLSLVISPSVYFPVKLMISRLAGWFQDRRIFADHQNSFMQGENERTQSLRDIGYGNIITI
jgi:hypothetical protein